jgi:chromosome partitioning protein
MRIAFVNQKGGVGKTTLAINVAGCMAQQGFKVLLVDADPQQSALDWSGVRTSPSLFAIVGMARPVIHRELPLLEEGYDHVVIDSPPSVHTMTQSIVGASDVVVVPVQPSPYDVWAAEAVLKVIDDASSVLNPALKTVFAINRKIVNTAIGRDVAASLGEYQKPVLKSEVCQRVAFAESAAQGKTVFELDEHSSAAQEIAALTKEILGL